MTDDGVSCLCGETFADADEWRTHAYAAHAGKAHPTYPHEIVKPDGIKQDGLCETEETREWAHGSAQVTTRVRPLSDGLLTRLPPFGTVGGRPVWLKDVAEPKGDRWWIILDTD